MSVAVWRKRREGDGKGGTWEEEGGVGGGTEECERRRWGGASINQCPPPQKQNFGVIMENFSVCYQFSVIPNTKKCGKRFP